ncbi:hypothetical protein [Clostridium butyricum]|uniref:hypothetical protein n=1 Tax=Clostridium butyricum TaxID=1492 RepID=UPI0018ABE736|nr:hypothetical protein [Clostridium butyricum]
MNENSLINNKKVNTLIDLSVMFKQKQEENFDSNDILDMLNHTHDMIQDIYEERNKKDVIKEISVSQVDNEKIKLLRRSLDDMKTKEKEYIDEISGLRKELVTMKKYREELDVMKVKMNISIPKITIIYIVLSSIATSFFAFNLFLTIFKGIAIIHPFTSLVFLVGSIGLLVTAIVSIKDWREFLKNE